MSKPDFALILTGARFATALLVAGLILWGDHAILTQGPGAASLIFGAALVLFGFGGLSDRTGLGRETPATSQLAAALDGVADKALVACALLALAATLLSRDLVVAAILLVARDLALLGLRHGLLQTGLAPTPPTDKLSTALAMAGIGGVLLLQTLLMLGVGVSAEDGQSPTALLYWFAQATLWAATLLSLWTGYEYARAGLRASQ